MFSPVDLATFSSDEYVDDGCEAEDEDDEDLNEPREQVTPLQSKRLSAFHPLKRQRLNVPVQVQNEQKRMAKRKELEEAFVAIQKLLKSKKTVFAGGLSGLQAHHAQAIDHIRKVAKLLRVEKYISLSFNRMEILSD